MILLSVSLFIIGINSASAAKIQTPNVEGGESLWFDIDLNTLGILGIDAWTNKTSCSSTADAIEMYLYSPEEQLLATKSSECNKVSITYHANITGIYKLRVYFRESQWYNDPRTITIIQ